MNDIETKACLKTRLRNLKRLYNKLCDAGHEQEAEVIKNEINDVENKLAMMQI